MRQTIREIEVNMAYLWFLGLELYDAIPHFSTLGKNYTRRFKDTDLFEQIFQHILEECYRFKLVDPTEVDLFNREIIGYNADSHKTAKLVKEALMTANGSLKDVRIFHTDCGNEFKNQLIDETLEAFEITRSLSHKGCPYDNAVAEATFKIIKTEFVKN